MHPRRVGRPHRFAIVFIALALTTGLVMVAAPAPVPASSGQGIKKVDARVLRAVQGGKSATYWAILSKRADLSGATAVKDWNARGWYVHNKLTGMANSSQRGLRAMLRAKGVSYRPFWIINAVRITSNARVLKAVAARSDVTRILPRWSHKLAPVTRTKDISAIEWNIAHINADDVWNTYNDRGEGVTVANIDTGVQYNHPALRLQYRGLKSIGGPTIRPNHNYAWYDPSRVCSPDGKQVCDNNGHGTHTMGVIVGDDGGSNQIGVAPRATWIAAKGCESNFCTDSALLASGEWMLAPRNLNDQNPRADLRPHVVNNSWGGGGGDPWYQSTVQAWVASGIFPGFSPGSSGPSCGTVGSPGDYPESYAVSAHDMNNNIASFASRGPSDFGGEIKPNVTAPGVSIRSSVPNNNYAIFSGTSMSLPHIVGTVALIWGNNGAPSLRRDIAGTRAIIDQTAIDVSNLTCGGSPGDNNVWGEGRLDAFAAVTAAKGL
ncbi:MAG: S8 family serine peptidase [Actinomycetota bacterium]